jgi:cytoskeletal protein RodZ
MKLASASTPREFGAALRAARERSGIGLEVIAERTKIARRVLELLEAGEYAMLPNRVFVRLFLQQYLAIIGEPLADWTPAFESTWQRFEDASQPWEVAVPAPSRGARVLPWVIGVVVVLGGVAGVLLVERHHIQDRPAPAVTTREAQPAATLPHAGAASAPVSAPPPTAAAAATPVAAASAPTAATPQADSSTLVLRALARACWVEVRIAGEHAESRLLAANSEWRVPAGGRAVAVTAGDGGALEIDYLGRRTERVGADGEVVRLHLGPAPMAAEPAP